MVDVKVAEVIYLVKINITVSHVQRLMGKVIRNRGVRELHTTIGFYLTCSFIEHLMAPKIYGGKERSLWFRFVLEAFFSPLKI
jgi:hypothetical protein